MEAATQAAPTTEHAPVTIAGRTFRRVETTSIQQDGWTMKRYRSSGIADMVKRFDPAEETLDALWDRILWEGLDSGIIYEILAGMLVEDGTAWTRKSAEQNTGFFASLSDMKDKLVVFRFTADIIGDFLKVAAVSKLTSQSSSSPQSATSQHGGDVLLESDQAPTPNIEAA